MFIAMLIWDGEEVLMVWYLYRYDGSIDFDCGGDLYDINLACYPNARLN